MTLLEHREMVAYWSVQLFYKANASSDGRGRRVSDNLHEVYKVEEHVPWVDFLIAGINSQQQLVVVGTFSTG